MWPVIKGNRERIRAGSYRAQYPELILKESFVMAEIDYDRIEEMIDRSAKSAASEVSTDIIQKTVAGVLKTHGIHDPKEMQELMVYGKRCMQDKREMRKGFFGEIGGNVATALITLLIVWIAI